MQPPNLYWLGEEAKRLDEMLFDLGGDVSDPDIEQYIDAWKASLDDRLEQKVDEMLQWRAWRISLAQARADEAARLEALAQQDFRVIEKLQKAIHDYLKSHGYKSFETAHFKLTVAGNGGKAPLEYPDEWKRDARLAPSAFQKQKIELDVEAIRAAVADGETVEGVVLLPRGTHLRIK